MSPAERNFRTVLFLIGIVLLFGSAQCFLHKRIVLGFSVFISALFLSFLAAAWRTKSGDRNKPSTGGFTTGLKKGLTRAILFDSAATAFENLNDRQQQALIENGAKLWLLARLNPEKTKRVKEFLTGGKKQSAQDRLNELKTLGENQLITAQEYEAKKAEIINQL